MILSAAVGALAGADRTAVGQTMLAHPVLAATITGMVLGDPATGLRVGVTLWMLSCAALPIGSTRAVDWTSAAVVVVALAVAFEGAAARGLALALAPPIAWAGGAGIDSLRDFSARRIEALRTAPEPASLRRYEREHLFLTALHPLRAGLTVAVLVTLASAAIGAVEGRLGSSEAVALGAFWRVAPVAALPLLLRFLARGSSWLWLVTGAVSATGILLATGAWR